MKAFGLEISRERHYRDTRKATRCSRVSPNGKCRMIDPKAAAKKALEYFTGLYPGAGGGPTLLEEVELTDDRKFRVSAETGEVAS